MAGGVDYASDLLGGAKAPAPAPAAAAGADRIGEDRVRVGEGDAPVDYAAALFGPNLNRENAKRARAPSLDDLNLANKESFDGTADFSTLVKANMVDDPSTKVRIFAKARFPKLAEKDAVARYGIVDGHVVYVGDDNKVYREDPPGFTGWLKDEMGAGTVANAPAVAGGVAGGMAGAPAGPAAMVAGGALGAAAGKGYGKVIANVAFDEPQTPGGNAGSMLSEGLWTGGGNFVGSLFGKFLGRHLARDISKLDDAGVADLKSKAAALGVELDPAQLTNLPSLKAKKDVLASMPTSRDIIAQGATKQAGQARAAVDRFLKGVSAEEGLEEAGEAARKGAGDVIEMVTKERAQKASPLYKAAFERFEQAGGIPAEILPRAEALMGRPAMKEAGKKAVLLAKNEGVDLADPKNSLLGMHYMKLALDDMIEGAGQQGFGGTYKRGIVGLKNQLLGIMDDLSPDYAEARKVFAHYSPNVTQAREGIVASLQDMSGEQLHKAAQMVLSGNVSPNTVGQTKQLFERAGAKESWDRLTAAYLQDTFEQAGRQFKTTGGAVNQAADWQSAMAGNPRQFRVLEKALDPQQFDAFKNMMDVFEAMGRTRGAGAGSQTMPRGESLKLLQTESGAGAIGTLAAPQRIPGRIADWLQEVRLGNHAEKLAEIITSPDGMKKLRELKRLSPNDQRFLGGASALFGIELKPANKPSDTAGQ